MSDDDGRPTPSVVVGAVSIGTAPLPFLAVYAVLFIVHGSVHPVNPPDVTTTTGGELVVGLIAVALFIVMAISLLWFLNGRRRWPYAILQLAVLGTAVDFFLDATKGGPFISFLVALTTIVSLILGFAPQAWRHLGHRAPAPVRALYGRLGREEAPAARPGTTALAQSAEPTAVAPRTLRRRRRDSVAGAGEDIDAPAR